jgi:hypothetical protein
MRRTFQVQLYLWINHLSLLSTQIILIHHVSFMRNKCSESRHFYSVLCTKDDRWGHFNFMNSLFQLHEFSISTSWIHYFNFMNSRFQLHEVKFVKTKSGIHEVEIALLVFRSYVFRHAFFSECRYLDINSYLPVCFLKQNFNWLQTPQICNYLAFTWLFKKNRYIEVSKFNDCSNKKISKRNNIHLILENIFSSK